MAGVHRDEEVVSLYTKTVNALYSTQRVLLTPNDHPIPLGVMLDIHA